MKQFIVGILLGVVLTMGGAWAYLSFFYITPIGDIKGQKGAYDGEEVRIRGVVGKSATIGGTGGYEVRDQTGTIVVITTTGAPDPDDKVTVVGEVDLILSIPVIRPSDPS